MHRAGQGSVSVAVMIIASMFEYNHVFYKDVDDKDVESLDKGHAVNASA
jgi:hypothetical protein